MFGGPVRGDTVGGEGQALAPCSGAATATAFPLAAQCSRDPDLRCCRLVPSGPCMADRLALGHPRRSRHTPLAPGELHAAVAALGAAKAAVGSDQRWTIGSIVCANQPRGGWHWHFHEVDPAGCVVWAYIAPGGSWEGEGVAPSNILPLLRGAKGCQG